ncbi:helix-turn-helix transcriptional regulator [Serratia aquatilis]|uniref:Helix-turn-helix transcriptional regulator n=1 Tax=Serratia aquatilis TaxID=1737515 RepID=A0ABV6EB85_9GAMM
MLAVTTQSRSTPAPIPTDSTPQDRFMRLPEVLYTTGLSRSTVYEMIGRSQFPSQISLGGKNVAWLESEVNEWMADRIANRHQEAAV